MTLMDFARDQFMELASARASNPKLHSLHEGYAVILEEVDELWEHVRRKRGDRSASEVYTELVQIAAMCQRTAEDVVAPRLGRAVLTVSAGHPQ